MNEKKTKQKLDTGTTIGCFYNEHTGSWLIFADRQITEGHRIMQGDFSKIYVVGNSSLMAGTGSVSDIQNLSKRVYKHHQMQRLWNDDDLNIDVGTFVKGLSEYLYDLKLDNYFVDICSDFIVCGFDPNTEKPQAYSISSDGALIEIETFYSNGSGSSYCLPQLKNIWDSGTKMTDLQLAEDLRSAVIQTSKIDLYTNDQVDIYIITKEGKTAEYINPDISLGI